VKRQTSLLKETTLAQCSCYKSLKEKLETGVHKEEEEEKQQDCRTISEIMRSGDFTSLITSLQM